MLAQQHQVPMSSRNTVHVLPSLLLCVVVWRAVMHTADDVR